jgi:hypothetical protein
VAAAQVDEGTPRFREIHFKNIVCAGAKRAVRLVGLPEMPVEKITFENVVMSADTGFDAEHAREVRVVKSRIVPQTGPAFRIGETANVIVE